ncbi:MAG: aminotransferase class I/II-fold pyridoxal phosphate-dependent enzyme [Blastocatellia bacterium]|nr:aminotransferase class I/II-fold pyridoxal phosphate-dependent enzyme [Blastocatellia bacterium]
MIQPAARTRNYNYAIRNIVVEAKKVEASGKKITYLNIGDPVIYGFQPPESLMNALAKAVHDGLNGYAPSAGTVEAREAIAADSEKYGVPISPDDVIVTSGASEAADLVLNALLEPGDDVLTPCPTYPLYTAITAKLGATENSYKLDPKNGWLPDPDDIRRRVTPRTRAIVIINPNNPSGAVYPEPVLRELLAVAAEKNLLVMADDVYHRMTYGPHAPRLASLAQDMDVPIVNLESLSKSHLVPGWRVGWMTFTNKKQMGDLIPAVRKIADARLCSPLPTQAVIPAALADLSHLPATIEAMKVRADISVDMLNAIPGMNCTRPEAAFYLMAQMENLHGATDEQFVLELLRETGILFVYGSGFGLEPTDGYFRIVFLPEPEVLRDVYTRLGNFVESWPHRARQQAAS